jgi:hypothetical protein
MHGGINLLLLRDRRLCFDLKGISEVHLAGPFSMELGPAKKIFPLTIGVGHG